jgi:hypothetical protein
MRKAYKVVLVLNELDPPVYASLIPATRRIYYVGERYDEGGPFFLSRTFLSAKLFAAMWTKDHPHVAIFRANCEPIVPQPKYFPCPLFASSEHAKKWRELVLQNVELADTYIALAGINYIFNYEDDVLCEWFELVGEPVAESVNGEWVIHDPSVLTERFMEVSWR